MFDPFTGPIKWCDEQVLRQYTRIGQHIPDEQLYKVTTVAGYGGAVASGVGLGLIIADPVLGSLTATGMTLPDNMYNVLLLGDVKKSESESLTLDPKIEFMKLYNKTARLPIFLVSAAYFGRFAYEISDYFLNGNPINPKTIELALVGSGLLGIASSMYLKDQDPKLLQKMPYWKRAYEFLKETTTSRPVLPAPVPVPVRD